MTGSITKNDKAMHIDEIDEFPSKEEIKKRHYHWRNKVECKINKWLKERNDSKKRKARNDEYAKQYKELANFWQEPGAERKQLSRLHQQMKDANKRCKHNRGRVTPSKLKKILVAEAARRAEVYTQENNGGMKKKKLLCIVGESGAGKTLASLHLKYKLGANVICSFTTRPPRETEVEGRDHHFVDIFPPEDQLLAFTVFGQYKYYALKSQVYGPVTVYVIDEDGLVDLIKNHGEEYEIYSVYITRRESLKLRSGVPMNRIRRDEYRTKLDLSFYNSVIRNNSTKAELFNNIESIYKKLLEE